MQNFQINKQFFSSDTDMQKYVCISGGKKFLFLENFCVKY